MTETGFGAKNTVQNNWKVVCLWDYCFMATNSVFLWLLPFHTEEIKKMSRTCIPVTVFKMFRRKLYGNLSCKCYSFR